MTSHTVSAAGRTAGATGAGFIPEIQGLRTVAIIMVATFHVWLNRVSGGVDVFLLISAYLMTRSLTRKSERGTLENPIVLIVQRFGRLMPLAAATVTITLVFGYFFLSQLAWNNLAADGLAAITYTENIHLQRQAVDYYADNSTASLFQHFWSLSIQGQVFILWAIIHYLAYDVATRTRMKVRPILVTVFTLVFIGSFAWSLRLTEVNQAWAYFDTIARMWEFAAGSLLALIPAGFTLPRALRSLMSWIGLIGVVSCGFVLPVESSFPGWAALWPVTSAALVIMGAGKRTVVGADRILSSRTLVFLGRYAYALYLVHWPVLIGYLTLRGQETTGIRGGTGILVLSAGLSVVLTHLVEMPVSRYLRKKPAPPRDTLLPRRRSVVKRPIAVMLVSALVTLAPAFGLHTAYRNAVDRQTLTLQSADLSAYGANLPAAPTVNDPIPGATLAESAYTQYGQKCPGFEQSPIECLELPGDADGPSVLFFGNSHSQQFSAVALQVAEQTGMRLRTVAGPGCSIAADPEVLDLCGTMMADAYMYAAEQQPDVIAFVGTMSLDNGSDFELPQTIKVVDDLRILSPKSQIVVFRDNPRSEINPFRCALQLGWDHERCQFRYEPAPMDELEAALKQRKALWIDMNDVICPDQVCRPQLGETITYFDPNHLTDVFIYTLAGEFGDRVRPTITWWPENVYA